MVAEVEQELRLNAIANLLLTDPTFSDFRPEKFDPPKEIARRPGELLKSRRAEVEEEKAWAEEQRTSFS